ncbi:MAG: prepilin peptidase CpaA [Clostridiales bacterium]|nr:prepilin peptidase CpaA [Clostridiales bacterium]
MLRNQKRGDGDKIQVILVTLFLTAAVCSDLYCWKIRNEIIFAGLALALLYVLKTGFFMQGLAGFILALLVLWPLFTIRVLGAGDTKVLAVLGIFYGYQKILPLIFASFLFGAILSIVKLIRYRNLTLRVQYLFHYVKECMKTKQYKKYYVAKRDGTSMVIHFSIAILLAHVGFLFGLFGKGVF